MYLALKAGKTSFCHLAQIGQPTEAYSTTVTLAAALPRSMSSFRLAEPPPPALGEQAAAPNTVSASSSATFIRNIENIPPRRRPSGREKLGAECDLSWAATE